MSYLSFLQLNVIQNDQILSGLESVNHDKLSFKISLTNLTLFSLVSLEIVLTGLNSGKQTKSQLNEP